MSVLLNQMYCTMMFDDLDFLWDTGSVHPFPDEKVQKGILKCNILAG